MPRRHRATSLFAPRPFCSPMSSWSPMRSRMIVFATIPLSSLTRTSASTPAPLINEDGYALGTLCVVDRAPRDLAPEQKEALKALSRLVLTQLEFRRNLFLLKETLTDRTREEHERQRELVHVQETLMRVMGLR